MKHKLINIEEIAWGNHGFPSGLRGVQNNPALFTVTGITEEITAAMPMTDAGIMEKIIDSLQHS